MVMAIITGPTIAPTNSCLNTKIKLIKLSTMMCPAVILANKRTINAKGFVIIPNNSTGNTIILNGDGAPGVLNK